MLYRSETPQTYATGRANHPWDHQQLAGHRKACWDSYLREMTRIQQESSFLFHSSLKKESKEVKHVTWAAKHSKSYPVKQLQAAFTCGNAWARAERVKANPSRQQKVHKTKHVTVPCDQRNLRDVILVVFIQQQLKWQLWEFSENVRILQKI